MLIVQLCCSPWMRLSYVAPLVGFFNLLALVGLWMMWRLRWGKWLVFCVLIAYFSEAFYRDVQLSRTIPFYSGAEHAQLVEQLSNRPGKFLVIVTYSPTHLPNFEEVYNDADIDSSNVIFAHEMGTGDDEKLINYFHDRTVIYWNVD